MNIHIYGSKVPQNSHVWGLNRHFKPNMRKIQIAISSDLSIWLTWNVTGSCGQQQRLRGWSRMVVKQFQDGRRPPFKKSIYRHISVLSNFHEILYTAADFELDERHVIKNEKVALDRLRVRQNVFLVTVKTVNYTVIDRWSVNSCRRVSAELAWKVCTTGEL